MFKFKLHLAALFLASMALPAVAADEDPPKEEQAPPAVRKIAIVDVNHLLKSHVRLKKQLADLAGEATLLQAKFESELKSLQKKAEGLKEMSAGSAEYNALESELVKLKAAMQADIELKRKEFVQREARLYYDAYQEIKGDIAKLAKGQHLAIVLNVNLDEINVDKPDEVARGITKQVVWFDESINLTPQMEKKYAAASPAASAEPLALAKASRDKLRTVSNP
jgi:Skp family chaperone for outer membrane proteins